MADWPQPGKGVVLSVGAIPELVNLRAEVLRSAGYEVISTTSAQKAELHIANGRLQRAPALPLDFCRLAGALDTAVPETLPEWACRCDQQRPIRANASGRRPTRLRNRRTCGSHQGPSWESGVKTKSQALR
jgi:hypothetical protein